MCQTWWEIPRTVFLVSLLIYCLFQIEGFMAGEDTTAPVVRRLRRTSQSGISASQPVMSSARRQTSAHNSLVESDMETPRALIQGFLRNGKCRGMRKLAL